MCFMLFITIAAPIGCTQDKDTRLPIYDMDILHIKRIKRKDFGIKFVIFSKNNTTQHKIGRLLN